MFYARIGALATRFRWQIVIGWVLAAIVITVAAPPLSQVTVSDFSAFLPLDAPFRHALDVYYEAFPNDASSTGVAIVLQSADGILREDGATFAEQIDTPAADFIRSFQDWLQQEDRAALIRSISTHLDSPTLADLLVAENNTVAIINVSLLMSGDYQQATKDIEAWLAENTPAGIQSYATGTLAASQATISAMGETVDSTIWVTIVLVVVLLLLIYRSPVSPLIPLFAVTIAFLISSGLAAFAAQSGVIISSYVTVLLVVVLYGAGTDYCLFLISRFREEMADHPDTDSATRETVQRVGETIASSAGTIFVGFMAMAFAKMGLFQTTGPALALGIAVTLAAGLTFVPALLALLGDRAFWPRKATHRVTGRYYRMISQTVSDRPLLWLVVIIGLMMPLSIHGVTVPMGYDLLGDLPDDEPVVLGFELVEENFGAGTIAPLSIVLTERDPAQIPAEIRQLSADLYGLQGVADIRSLDAPLGKNGSFQNLLRVDGQMNLILSLLQDALQGGTSSEALDLQASLAAVGAFNGYLTTVTERFPQMADNPDLQNLQGILSNPLRLATQRDQIVPSLEAAAQAFAAQEGAYLMPDVLQTLVADLPEEQRSVAQGLLDQLISTYLAEKDGTYRLVVLLEHAPDSIAAMDTVDAIRDLLQGYQGAGEAVVSGQAPVLTDIRNTVESDLLRAIGFVMLGIFIVLLLMLRSVIAPLYLIATVALTYAFTLGLTDLVFRFVTGVERLAWYVPFFTFVFLVALGVDYSIFLIGRIKEEVPQHGNREGVHIAVAATGAIITSAGVILAGTFAAMITGSIKGLAELGFAVAFGVLIDTFVVRTMLVPAITILLGKWAWFPRKMEKQP